MTTQDEATLSNSPDEGSRAETESEKFCRESAGQIRKAERQAIAKLFALALCVPLLTASGCIGRSSTFIDDAVRLVKAPGKLGSIAGDVAVPVPPPDPVEQAIRQMLTDVADLTKDDAVMVTQHACIANDAYQALTADSIEEGVTGALASLGGNAMFSTRMRGVALELNQAESSGDAARLVAATAVCEAVGIPR